MTALMPQRRKIGTRLRAALLFDAAEWAAFDPVLSPVVAALRQGADRHPLQISIEANEQAVAMELDTSALRPGSAVFDVWIGDEPLPRHSNIRIEFFQGAGR